jgi:ferredoxin
MCTALRKNATCASNCVGCGKCEKHCPQGIKIRENLKEAKKDLETPDVINLSGSKNVENGLMKVDNYISNLYNQLSQKYKGYNEFNKILQNLQQIQNNSISLKNLQDLLTPTQNLYDNLNTCQKFLDSNNDKDNSQKINTIKQNVEKLLGVIKNNGNEQIGDGGQSTLKQLSQGNNSKFDKAIKTQANIPSDGSVINLGSGQGNNIKNNEDNNSKQLSLFNDENNSNTNSNKFNTDVISKNLDMLNKRQLNSNRQQIILQNKNLLQNNYNKIQKYFTELAKSGQKVKSLETQFVKSYNELYNSCINKNSNNQNIIQNINNFYKNVNKIFDIIRQKNKDKNFDKTNSKILISAINRLANTLIKSCFNGLSQNFNVNNKNFITMREMKEQNLNENKITKIVDNCVKNYFRNL